MITIVDYGMGNLASIKNMLKKIGEDSHITSSLEEISNASKLILPGVGAFDNAIENINKLGLQPVLNQKVLNEKIPVLGICLGMQLLMDSSEEGQHKGFGWIQGKVRKFVFDTPSMKVPHMGWNLIQTSDKGLFRDLSDARFYFVHSYYVSCDNRDNVLATSHYGNDFVSAVHQDNIYGTQFHPEKSHKFGMKLLKNFVSIN